MVTRWVYSCLPLATQLSQDSRTLCSSQARMAASRASEIATRLWMIGLSRSIRPAPDGVFRLASATKELSIARPRPKATAENPA